MSKIMMRFKGVSPVVGHCHFEDKNKQDIDCCLQKNKINKICKQTFISLWSVGGQLYYYISQTSLSLANP